LRRLVVLRRVVRRRFGAARRLVVLRRRVVARRFGAVFLRVVRRRVAIFFTFLVFDVVRRLFFPGFTITNSWRAISPPVVRPLGLRV
jgi:hypothetical protein